MLKIGDFSRISRVSVKALRFYDEIGLLRPATVDAFSGYRYYSAAQLTRLNRILALKDLGLSLEQIGGILDQELSRRQIETLFQMKAEELRSRLREDEDRLRRIEARLRQIEQEDQMSDYEVVIKSVPAVKVAAVRGMIPSSYEGIGPIFDRMFDQLYDYVCAAGVRTGPAAALYLEPPGPEQDIPVEAVAPLFDPLQPSKGVEIHDLPAEEQMASTVHHGSFANLNQAYQALMQWLEANGYHITGACREIYHEYDRSGDQSKWVTEIQFPVSK